MFTHLIRRAVFASTALFTLTACGSDSATGPASVVGSFSLQTVNGKALPYVFTDSTEGFPITVEIMSPSAITINADGSFRFSLTFKVSAVGASTTTATDVATGTYTRAGNTLSMTANGSTLRADWDGGDTLTLVDSGEVMVFKR